MSFFGHGQKQLGENGIKVGVHLPVSADHEVRDADKAVGRVDPFDFGVVRERDEGVVPGRTGNLSEDNREGHGWENG